ncbi:MAG: hypothetical protein HFH82_00470 [Lachnospiraceae bacterium]|nr:hypothetical protein [Lachnospiraceae bacterium]
MNQTPNNEKVIIYKSSTQFTEKYAYMIGLKLHCAAFHIGITLPLSFLSYFDTIIFGTRVHGGKIVGLKQLKKLLKNCKNSKIILFVTGATPNTATEVIDQLWKRNLNSEELERIPHFYLQSGLCYEKMRLLDKLEMKTAKLKLKKKTEKTPYEALFEEVIRDSYDISSKHCIEPLISYITANCE